jgi:hypothetical protein
MQFDFGFGGGRIPTPGYWIISQNPIENGLKFDVDRGLVDSDGTVYSGDEPVVVVSLDGAAQPHLASFQPLLASASILNQFFSQQDGTEASLDTILNAVKLYNDLSYRKKAEDAKDQMSSLQPTDPDYAKLAAELKAFSQNIGEARLQLPASPKPAAL